MRDLKDRSDDVDRRITSRDKITDEVFLHNFGYTVKELLISPPSRRMMFYIISPVSEPHRQLKGCRLWSCLRSSALVERVIGGKSPTKGTVHEDEINVL